MMMKMNMQIKYVSFKTLDERHEMTCQIVSLMIKKRLATMLG